MITFKIIANSIMFLMVFAMFCFSSKMDTQAKKLKTDIGPPINHKAFDKDLKIFQRTRKLFTVSLFIFVVSLVESVYLSWKQ